MPRLDTATRILCSLLTVPDLIRTGDSDALVQMACRMADKLETECADMSSPKNTLADRAENATAEDMARDEIVLDRLLYVLPSGGGLGIKRALWARACAAEGIGRRAFDSSRMRLLLSARVRQVGKRYSVANSDAA